MPRMPEAVITRPAGLDAVRQILFETLQTVPDYQTYRDSEEVHQGFADLCEQYQDADDVRVRLETIQPNPEVKEALDALVIELPDADDLEDHSTVFLIGNVHTNELVWTQTFDFVSKLFAAHPELMRLFGIKRVIFLDAFPGGMKINGDDLVHRSGEMTIRSYFKNAGRSHLQTAWDFDLDYKDAHHRSQLLGTKVAEVILRKYLPNVTDPLHNASVNGMYTYLSHPVGALVEDLDTLRKAIEPELPAGTPELPDTEEFGPGVFKEPTVEDYYDRDSWHKGMGADPLSFLRNIVGVAKFYSAHLNVSNEAPYFISSALMDHDSSGETMQEVRSKLDPEVDSILQQMASIVESVDPERLPQDLQHLHAATSLLNQSWQKSIARRRELPIDPSTECLSIAARAKFYIRYIFYLAVTFGQAARLAEQTGNTAAADQANLTLDRIAQMTEEYLQPNFLPRRIQVAIQTGALVLAGLAQKEHRAQAKT